MAVQRAELFSLLARERVDEVVVHTMSTVNDWPKHSSHELDFFVQGAMGYASSVGLGAALGQPGSRVWVLDGDGSLLMNMGTLTTIARAKPRNLVHVVLDNGVYELTGQVATPGAGVARLADIARAAGIAEAHELETRDAVRDRLPALLGRTGPVFVSISVSPRGREPMGAAHAMKRAPESAAHIHAHFAEAEA